MAVVKLASSIVKRALAAFLPASIGFSKMQSSVSGAWGGSTRHTGAAAPPPHETPTALTLGSTSESSQILVSAMGPLVVAAAAAPHSWAKGSTAAVRTAPSAAFSCD